MSNKDIDNNSTDIIEVVNSNNNSKGKRGSKSASVEVCIDKEDEVVKQIIRNNIKFWKYTAVKSDDECALRLDEFFGECQRTGELPTVEKMCLALGVVRKTVWEWEQGKLGSTRSNMIKTAKELLSAIDAELVSTGKIPQITYIFRSKNFFGMTDKQEIEIAPNRIGLADRNPEEIAMDYVEQDTKQLPKKDF